MILFVLMCDFLTSEFYFPIPPHPITIQAPNPPPAASIQTAIDAMKNIDALDKDEELTELGHHLADLPLPPHLGKMVLYSIILRCVDPVLTIASALAYRDPFIVPLHPSQKRSASKARVDLADRTFR